MVLFKIIGGLSVVFGLFLMFGVPAAGEYQPPAMSKTAILIGIFFVILGIYLMTL
ncbi:MAG: hypothetical protein HY361_02930 [Candidatus Aenigmarchaeota archaeon]|nr:hypothetical protein [Candidatus Aenigmarchaeota archaeon]